MALKISTIDLEKKIYLIRGERVMLDSDIAELYGVSTKQLVQAMKRNIRRFPPDFMFQVAKKDLAIAITPSRQRGSDDDKSYEIRAVTNLRSQFVTSSYGGRRYLPYAFTEQGIAMLSGVLTSPRAITANIEIMRAFVKLRKILSEHRDLAKHLEELEKKYFELAEEIKNN